MERELQEVQRRLDRLLDALADGTLPADEIKARLSAEKACKTALEADLRKLGRVAEVAGLDPVRIKHDLQERVRDVAGLLTRHTVQARQMLRKVLADKIELEPIGSGRKRGLSLPRRADPRAPHWR